MGMLKLVRFRPLANEEDLCRAIRTITTGEFWCPKLWDMNDPMEGVYLTSNKGNLDDVFKRKNEYLICSFSDNDGQKSVENPLMWGYYANGFKGIAIEIEVGAGTNNVDTTKKVNSETFDLDEIKIEAIAGIDNVEGVIRKVHYEEIFDLDEMVRDWKNNRNSQINDMLIRKIITTKLKFWEKEKEWRFLIKSNASGYYKIGKIKHVYIGTPYKNVENSPRIVENSVNLQKYQKYKRIIENHCRYLSINSNEFLIKYAVLSGGKVDIK